MLSIALDQSNVSIAQSLTSNTFALLRKGSPELAWECYNDLTARGIQKYISREQYKQLIKQFNHVKTHHAQSLEYILTLIEDMKQLGYQVGRKEKLLMMRLLGQNGNIKAMEKVFQDLKSDEEFLFVQLPVDGGVQKPFNIMLTSFGEHVETMGILEVAQKSMDIYGEMLDRNIQPAPSTTRLLMSNIKLAERSDEMAEKVWDWVWAKIGMNVGGKTKELDPTLYRDMVMYFASAGRPEYALEINDIMKKRQIPRTVRMMTALIHKVGRAGDINRSMDLLNEMMIVEGLVPTLVTFNALIDIHAHKKPEPDVEGAKRMYNMLGEVGLAPDTVTFGTLIDMYAKKGDLANAKRLYHEMSKSKDVKFSAYVYSSFIECFMRLNDKKSAMAILQVLKKQADRRVATAREAYNLMFKGLVESGSIREAIVLLEMMSKETMGLEPRTFGPLLSYYAKRGDPKGAHKVASMMTQAKVKPTSHTYAILLNSFARAGDMEGAENIFNILKQKYRPDSYAYNSMLYVYTKNNEMDKVLDTYKRMSKAYVPANEYTYGILMYFYSRRKEVRSVESLIKTMQANHLKPGAVCWTILMQTYFECKQFDEGRKVMEQMIDVGLEPSSESWSILINGCIQGGSLDYAESVLQQNIDRSLKSLADIHKQDLLKDAVGQPENTYEKSIPETIEDVLAKETADGNLYRPSSKLSPYLFTPIIDAYGKAGEYDKAKLLFRKMCALSVPVTIPAYVTLMTIFQNDAKYDAVETMWQALYKPANNTRKLENLDPLFDKPIPVPDIEYDYTNLLTLDGKEDTKTRPITAKQVSPFALSVYMHSLMSQQRHDDIEALWKELLQEGYEFDEHNWNKYIVSLVEAGQYDEACQVVSQQFLSSKSSLNEENDNEANVKKTLRKRDDIFISNDDQLHTRTCAVLANALQITGAENMGEPRLRSAVTYKIKKYIQQKSKSDEAQIN